MAAKVTNYQCPNCAGALHFSSETGRLECDYCDSSFSVAEVEAFYAAKDAKAAAALKNEDAKPTKGGEGDNYDKQFYDDAQEAAGISQNEKIRRASSNWDESTVSEDWGELKGNIKSYICPSCGAELICEETTAATSCPFCGNNTVVPGKVSDSLKPDYIIPFKLDKEAAIQALKRHYGRKIFLPKTFREENQIEKIQGIYVPFWLFDADVDAEARYACKNSTSHRSGDYIVTTTRHYDVRRSGNVQFEKVPADASAKMPDDLMDSLEPFNYSEMVPFSSAYFPGYLADKYDVEVPEAAPRADVRFKDSVESYLRKDVHGYQVVTQMNLDTYIDRKRVSYALLPVWMLKTRWENKTYLFAMNGQTGKFVGDLPVSKKRYWLFVILIAIALTIACSLLGVGRFLASIIAIFLE